MTNEAIEADRSATTQIAADLAIRLQRKALLDQHVYAEALRAADDAGMPAEQAAKFAASHVTMMSAPAWTPPVPAPASLTVTHGCGCQVRVHYDPAEFTPEQIAAGRREACNRCVARDRYELRVSEESALWTRRRMTDDEIRARVQ